MNLLRTFLLLCGFLCAAGCSSTLIPSDEGGRFVLSDDVVYWGKAEAQPLLFGLTKGEYIAVGHNDEGIYYRGPRGCVIILLNPDGIEFLKSGKRPNSADMFNAYGPNGEGGVFVPYDSSELPFFYVYHDYRGTTGDRESRMPTRPSSEINTFKGESPVGEAIPFKPTKVYVVNPQNPTALPDPATAAGASIAPYAGRALVMPLMSNVQGKPVQIFGIIDEALRKRLNTHMREHRYTKSSVNVDESVVASKK